MLLRLTLVLLAGLYVGMRFLPTPEMSVYTEQASSQPAEPAAADSSADREQMDVAGAGVTTRADTDSSIAVSIGQGPVASNDAALSLSDGSATSHAPDAASVTPTQRSVAMVSQQSEPLPQAMAQIIATNVNVRAGPSQNNAVVAQVDAGDTVRYYGEPASGWAEIGLSQSDARVYMASRFLQPVSN